MQNALALVILEIVHATKAIIKNFYGAALLSIFQQYEHINRLINNYLSSILGGKPDRFTKIGGNEAKFVIHDIFFGPIMAKTCQVLVTPN